MTFPVVPYDDWVQRGEFAQLDDGRMFYVHAGSGPPVVFMHHFGSNSWWYSRVLDAIAEHFSVYAIDLPGCAQSDTPDLPYDLPDVANALEQFMDTQEIGKAHIVAIGGSAMTCAHFAATRPERVDKLVLEVIPHWTREEAKTFWRETVQAKWLDEQGVPRPWPEWGDPDQWFPGLDEETRKIGYQRYTEDYREHGRWWLTLLSVGQLRYDVMARLPEIQATTLVLYGENVSNFLGKKERVVEAIKSARLEEIPLTKTTSAFDQPELYTRLVTGFLNEPSSPY